MPSINAIIIFAHGASDPEWAEPFESIRNRILLVHPDWHVALAFLERMSPSLETSVKQAVLAGAKTITIVPFFLARGGHLKKDLPPRLEALKNTYGNILINMCNPLGESESMLDAMANWAVQCSCLSENSLIRQTPRTQL
ncbi:MAG: CbiX/SirB N-terminal domain-containing protein [Pseudomonadota bacterium]|nr:CbiX/SirB N-terminal domain-containing protein [Pseudomonadota bacterium]